MSSIPTDLLNRMNLDVDALTDDQARKLLVYSATRNATHTIRALVPRLRTADFAYTDDKPFTPLHGAAYSGRLEACVALVELYKVNVNSTDPNGITPLYDAAVHGRENDR